MGKRTQTRERNCSHLHLNTEVEETTRHTFVKYSLCPQVELDTQSAKTKKPHSFISRHAESIKITNEQMYFKITTPTLLSLTGKTLRDLILLTFLNTCHTTFASLTPVQPHGLLDISCIY